MESTQFAPAKRSHLETVQKQSRFIQKNISHLELLESIPQILAILNTHRQIIYANQKLADALKIPDLLSVLGKRPGEVLDCIHAHETNGGCGTTAFCKECGAVNTILEAQNDLHSMHECRILTRNNAALDLRVWAQPLILEDKKYTIFTVSDIGDEKRREALERTFFHDIMNTAGNILNASDLFLEYDDPDIRRKMTAIITNNTAQLINEIRSHRILLDAERGDLIINMTNVSAAAAIEQVVSNYQSSPLTQSRIVNILPSDDDVELKTDLTLLVRTLSNLLKNALEAAANGETVALSYESQGDMVHFTVHNPNYMTQAVQHQVFQRSFSTKGSGRGIGTYSIKLLTEKYLHGQVWFESSVEAGTSFTLALPLNPVF